MSYKLSDAEKDAHKMIASLIKKPTKFKASDFKPGNIVLYTYRAKTVDIYDMSPMIMVLRRTGKYTLGWSINWTPPALRKRVIKYIMTKNKNNIKKGKDLVVSYDMIKNIIKGLGPVIRLYFNNRISPKGVVVPHHLYLKVIDLRAEHFIGISSQEAWNHALKIQKTRKNKKRKVKK